MIKTKLLFILFLGMQAFYQTQSQEVLINEQPDYSETLSLWGPNRKNHIQFIMGLNNHLPIGEKPIPIKYFASVGFSEQLQYKKKLSQTFSLLLSGGFEHDRLIFPESANSVFTDKQSHQKENLRLNWMVAQAFLRINFDKHRGNYSGIYCDLGIYSGYLLGSRLVTKDIEMPETKSHAIKKTVYRSINSVNMSKRGMILRLGYNFMAIKYQIQFSEPVFYPDVSFNYPCHQIGIICSIPR